MASVPLSSKLKEAIISNSEEMFSTTIEQASKTLADDFGDRVYENVYGEYKQHIEGLKNFPHKPFEPKTELKVLINKITVEVKLSMQQLVYDPPSLYVYNPKFMEVTCPKLIKEYEEYKERVKEKTESRQSFVNQVTLLLTQCNTLAQFLDAFPSGRELVPQEYMERLHAKKPRIKGRNLVTPNVSRDLNVTVLTQKIISRS